MKIRQLATEQKAENAKRVVWASPKAWQAFDQMTLGKNAK